MKHFERLIAIITRGLVAIAGAFLVLMMLLTAADVACRYIFSSPIAGAMELVEYMMAVLIPFSIAYCALEKSHVAVEFVFQRFPEPMQVGVNIIMLILSISFLTVMTWQNILYIGENYSAKLTSAVLLIPTYPFVIPIALGTGVFVLILLLQLIKFQEGTIK